jgi:cullin-associated NEDD8-dissociated protein 1
MEGSVIQLLERTKHHDKDERYMAISDLKEKLESSANIDTKLQPNVRDAIMLRLKDESSDVQAIAVNCLGAIVQKFSMEFVVQMVTELGNLAISGKLETRDNYSQGIRTILKALPAEFGAEVAAKLAPILLGGLTNVQTNVDNRIAYLVILADLLNNYGSLFQNLHKNILNTFMDLLEHQKVALRKEASIAIGALVKVLEDEEFSMLMNSLIKKTREKSKDNELLFNYVQTIAVVT